MWYLIDGVVCLFAGGVLTWLYAKSVIADYEKAASAVGTFFQKLGGKVTAVKKAL
jgi:hypothetical protein